MKPDAFSRVYTSEHALRRVRERLLWEDDGHLEERVRVDVRLALIAGNVTQVRPNWSRGHGADEFVKRSGCWYAWDAETTRCWILEVRDNRVSVMTVVPAIDVAAARAEGHHVRRGMTRRRPA